ncbi:ABC transporter permease [Nocardia sp. NPDC057353]|uniref:ABC transporter permease n=1 Tax=Nocardia sp. NPDC057353 TaxID=3346104 RepID=UPI003627114F
MTAPAAGARVLLDTRTMLDRNLRNSLRSPDALIMTIAVPVLILLMFVYVLGGAIEVGGGTYVDYVVPGILLLCAGFGSATTAVSVCTDVTEGFVDRFRTMAVARSAFLNAHVAESLLRNLFTTALVTVLAVLIGFRPTADPLRWLAALGLVALFVLALSWISAALGLLTRSVEAANGSTFAFLFLPYVSSAFVPVESMPGWLRPVAEHQPVTPVIETVRGLLIGTPIGSSAVLAVSWCALFIVVGYLGALAAFRARTRD